MQADKNVHCLVMLHHHSLDALPSVASPQIQHVRLSQGTSANYDHVDPNQEILIKIYMLTAAEGKHQ